MLFRNIEIYYVREHIWGVVILNKNEVRDAISEYDELVYLKGGEIYFADSPVVVHTILGSCVALVLYSKTHKISAICHAKFGAPKQCAQLSGKCIDKRMQCTDNLYASCMWRKMIQEMEKRNVKRGDRKVKIFGGASILKKTPNNTQSIGENNVQTMLDIIERSGIALANKAVLGGQGRVLYLMSDIGRVYVKGVGVSKEHI